MFKQRKNSHNAIVPSSSVESIIKANNVQVKSKFNKTRNPNIPTQESGESVTEISEQRLKEIHLIYESILNKKKT